MARAAAPVQVRALKFEGTVAGAAASVALTNNSTNAPVLYYSFDGRTWTQWNYSALSCPKGTPVYIRGNNPNGFSTNGNLTSRFTFTAATGNTITCDGDVTSLLDYENEVTTLPTNYCFYRLFYQCTTLAKAPSLPALTVTNYCYNQMFFGCTSLTAAPDLPATTLGNNCYYQMFEGCTSLTDIPTILPAPTLMSSCYSRMFYGCTSLTYSPELPALTATINCYTSMFTNCRSLVNVGAIRATSMGYASCQGMFEGCTSLQTAPELPATTLNSSCYSGMFRNCTALRTAPAVLPALTLSNGCYGEMFRGCSMLERAPRLPAETLVSSCYQYMFRDCAMLSEITARFLTTPGTNYTASWVQGVAASGTFTKSARATWQTTGVNGVPTGWTITTE